MALNGPRKSRILKVCSRIQLHHSQIITILVSRGNGKAESAVKITKNVLKKSRKEDPYLALLAYRNSPQQIYNYSPAQRLMSRRLKDIIPTAPPSTQPTDSVPKSSAWRHYRKKTEINGSVQQEGFAASQTVLQGGKSVCETKAWK